MVRQVSLVRVCFAALVALERLLPRVRPNVLLQVTIRSTSENALVTLEWLLPCVDPHHVHFQLPSLNAGKLARCASVWLFSRVGSFVSLQMA